MFKSVAVVGGGLMGSGIAAVTAMAGVRATVIEVNPERAAFSKASVKDAITYVATRERKLKADIKIPGEVTSAERFISAAMSRFQVVTNLREGLSGADLAVEAIVENLQAKRTLFAEMEALCSPTTVLATNTSSLSVDDISKALKAPGRFAGLHFFSPVHRMPLVEVVRAPSTDAAVADKLATFCAKTLGKKVVRCGDTPGFVVNRLLVPLMMEAVRMHERGDATPAEIDIAMVAGAGHPMGPFQLADMVGNDVTAAIIDGWADKYPTNALFARSKALSDLVKDGRLGRKAGRGWYDYPPEPKKAAK